ncbi:MAG: ABC transporter permease, partial [Desulfofustis sp.]|nr:ABC transporter permease [Desulfofustis sp.]
MAEFFSDSVRTAVISLAHHKMRSLLSIIGIVCGVSTVLAIFAIGAGAEAETMRRIGQLGLSNIYLRSDDLTDQQIARAQRYQSRGLQLGDLTRLETTGLPIKRTAASRDQRVDLVGLPDGLSPRVIETTRDYRAILGLTLAAGRFLADRDLADRNRVCVLGWTVSTALGADGKPGALLRIGPELWQIVGVLDRQDIDAAETGRVSLLDINTMIIVPLGTMGPMEGGEPVSELIVELATVERIDASLAVLTSTIRAAHNGVDDFTVIVPFELLTQARSIQRLFTIVFGSIGALSLIIGGVGIMNI